ncbi:ligand-binding sensor domain-containing protein [Aureispira anguillae]|uniref:Two component regulator propeller n=1 Tax=Aureispira anguillae TaxID=2864201 RepID=A0A916DRZ0_9BACT|nr:two-component regulator propeller domain-containing protein [Aureispira anguillae]BDS11556.1 hypothetical protein AsAng_0022700 [Aureispira anguillae]
MKCIFWIAIIFLSTSCKSKNRKINVAKPEHLTENNVPQIGQYITEIFEDSKGNIWFGTLEKGVAKYDGLTLSYFTQNDGLPSNTISSIVEDKKGTLWFGTHAGLSKYDGKSFINFTEKDGLCHLRISNLLLDSNDNFWIGTWGGVCQYDGTKFTNFLIPYAPVDTYLNEDTKDWVTEIMEDSKGNIWLGRDGYGASKYDGQKFVHFTKADGLYSNNVQEIQEDKNGNIWFGTRVAEKDHPDENKRFGKGGITRCNEKGCTHFPEIEGLNNSDTYAIYKDNSGNLWISTLNNGMYRYDGKAFKNYPIPIPIMSIMEDKNGKLWFGGAGGLYAIDTKGTIANITVKGPWK